MVPKVFESGMIESPFLGVAIFGRKDSILLTFSRLRCTGGAFNVSVRPPTTSLASGAYAHMLLRTVKGVRLLASQVPCTAQRVQQTFEQQSVRPIPIQLISHLIR